MKIFWFCRRDIYERLRVAIHQREPGALDLHHDTVPAPECVEYVGHGEPDRGGFARFERLRFLEAVSELSAEHVSTHELLIVPHANACRIGIRIGEIPRIHINKLEDPIGIRAGGRNAQACLDWTRNREIFL